MMKRIAAVAAISVAAMQVLTGFTGVALADPPPSNPRFGTTSHTTVATDSCTVAAGIAVVQSTTAAAIWTDGTYLYCDVQGSATFATAPKLSDVSSVIVYANTDVVIYLATGNALAQLTNNRIANYGGLKVTADAADELWFDGGSLDAPYGGTITVTDTTFSGQGLVGTIYSAAALRFDGGDGTDNLDASAVSGVVTAYGYAGSDTLRSGSGDDSVSAGMGSDKVFTGAGYDRADCGDSDAANDQCWAGTGDDTILVGTHSAAGGYDIAAPGDGYDTVTNSSNPYAVTYVDSSVAVEFDGTGVYSDTGDDTLGGGFVSFTGSPKGDTLYGFPVINGGAGADVIIGTEYDGSTEGSGDDVLSGGGGKDKIRSMSGDDEIYGDSGADTIKGGSGDDMIYGGGGDDVLYGLGGVDFLKGGTGLDQTWGGPGVDTCSGEVRDSCEFRKG